MPEILTLKSLQYFSEADLRVDPVTAIKVGVAVIEKLSSIKGEKKQKKALAAIAAALASIKADLAEIKLAIAEIKNALAAIEQKIDQLPELQALQQVLAIQDVIRENYPSWSGSVTASELDDIRRLRLDLQTANRLLMRSGGYAYAFTIAHSFVYELNLALLVKLDHASVNASKAVMLEYLAESVNPNVTGSIGWRYARAKAVTDVLEAWQSALVRDEFVRTGWYKSDENSWGYVMCKGDFYKVIIGDLENGFRVVDDVRNTTSCYSKEWPHGVQPITLPVNDARQLAQAERLASQAELDAKSKLFRENIPIVRLGDEIIPAIKRIMQLIEERVTDQMSLS